MKNPWLEIKAEDYEGHMGSPNVDQLYPLRKIFRNALKKYPHKRLAVLGCATGNGFEEIDFKKVEKVFAIDINPKYLHILIERFKKNDPKIETIECDLNATDISLEEIDLIYAALIFEYVDIKIALKKISKWLRKGSILVSVLQLPCENIPEVTPSPYKSLEKLSSIMKLVSPEDLIEEAIKNNLSLISSQIHPLKSGKKFWEGRFLKK